MSEDEKKEEKKKVVRYPLDWSYSGFEFEAVTPAKAAETLQEFLFNNGDKFEGPLGVAFAHAPGSRHMQAYEVAVTVRLVRRPEDDYLKGTAADPEFKSATVAD